MTQSCEVLATMDARTTTFGRKKSYTISRCGAFFLGSLFLVSLILIGLSVYYFAPCAKDRHGLSTEPTKKTLHIKLPTAVVPDSYELWMIPFIWEGNFTFHGEVKILVNVTKSTKNITLHAVDMKIDEGFTNIREHSVSKTNKTKVIKIVEQKNDTDGQFHVIKISTKLKKGMQYIVHLKFTGYLNNHLYGFYRSSYTIGNDTRWIATTQFEPKDARRAFPCFDEPALKAKFQLNIGRPKNMTSISNMPKEGKPTPVSGLDTYEWDHYMRSVPMSTYLVAFIVSDFDKCKSEDDTFSVWTHHDVVNQSEYSLQIGPKILRYYEHYFKVDFPLPKMDLVAIPDFSVGAMENWGLITFRETAILYKKDVTTNKMKQWVAQMVSHELAHQWFGNLVTPSWWTDIWLNKGFASYMEYIGTNAVEPTWKVLEQFVVDTLQPIFDLDALLTSHPIHNVINDPSEIEDYFDRITYLKGAAIIRMLHHFLTTDVFKRGLTNYLNGKAYQSADQNDLWNALTKQAHKDKVLDPNITVKEIMDTWTLQTGFPVVTVSRNYSNYRMMLTQERFLLDNDTTMLEPLWWIPITYTSEKQLDFNNTQPRKWMKAERSIILNDSDVSPSQWVLFNVQEIGCYRVNYDRRNWQMIIKQLEKNFNDISTINRAQLIDDAFNLARAGKLDYTIAFNITSYLVNEIEYLPWKTAFNAMSYLDDMLIKTQCYDKFRLYVLKIINNVYDQVGFTEKVGDSQLTVFTRINVLNWACYFGHELCVKHAVEHFRYWRKLPNPYINNPISPNLRDVVYCTAIRVGGQSEWEFAWQQYLRTDVGSEKELLLQALACTREIWLLSRYLNWAFMENSGIRKQDAITVFESVANNIVGQSLTFDYFRDKWTHLKNYFGMSESMEAMNKIIKLTTRNINTKYKLKNLVEFAKEHVEKFNTSTRTMEQVKENAEYNIRWLNKYYGKIHDWLQKNVE